MFIGGCAGLDLFAVSWPIRSFGNRQFASANKRFSVYLKQQLMLPEDSAAEDRERRE